MTRASGQRRAITILLPSALLVLLVLFEGTQRFSIQHTAGYFEPFWARHFSTQPYQRFWEFIEAVRKLGHLVGYGVVCLGFWSSVYFWIRRTSPLRGWELKNRAAGWALVLTMLLGSADELNQRFVPQRTSTITDVGFDVCGGFFFLMFLFALMRWRSGRERPRPGFQV
jgi:VanZ family protein